MYYSLIFYVYTYKYLIKKIKYIIVNQTTTCLENFKVFLFNFVVKFVGFYFLMHKQLYNY